MTSHSAEASLVVKNPFCRWGKDEVFPSFEKNLFPNLTSQDVVEILGEAGSGKTELLYHFISSCILPPMWKGMQINGLEIEITFIDNDCHFDLLRLVAIMEQRVKILIRASRTTLNKKDILSFVQDSLKLLHIIKCFDSDEFIITLNSLESALWLKKRRNIIMIDGLSSFYLADRAKFINNLPKLIAYYKIIINLIIKISKKGTPVVASRRKLLNVMESDKKVFGQLWNSTATWRFELQFHSSLPDKTVFKLLNTKNAIEKLCYVSSVGFIIVDSKT